MNIEFQWGTVLMSLPMVLLSTWGAVQFLSKSYVTQQFNKQLEKHKSDFNKQLEKHKSDLQLIIEMNKFDMQRKMHDFSLYTTKKHEVYASIYGLFLDAEGKSRSLLGFREVPDYPRYNAKELEQSLKAKGIPDIKIEYFVTRWDEKDKHFEHELKNYIRFFEIQTASSAINAANNKFLESRLYVSDNIEQIGYDLIKSLRSFLIDVESFLDPDYPAVERRRVSESIKKNEANIELGIRELKKEMQKEMSIGYYH